VTGATATAPAEAPSPEERLARGQAFSLTLPGVLLVAMTLLGLGLRLYRLDGRSLWLDELITAYSARQPSPEELMGYVRFWIDNTPLIWIEAWLLRGLGPSEVAVRLPFVVYGTLAIPAMYALGKALAGVRVGLVGALLMTIGPFAVWYSQEARHYAPLLLFTTLQMLLAYRAARRGRALDWVGLTVISALNLYTSYLAMPVTAVAYLYVGVVALAGWTKAPEKRSGHREAARPVAYAVASAVGVVLAFAPWLPALGAFLARRDVGFGGLEAGKGNALSSLNGLDLGVPLGLFAAAGLGVMVYRMGRGRWRAGLLVLMWVGLTIGFFLVSSRGMLFAVQSRYLSTLYPAGLLLADVGLVAIAVAVGRIARSGRPRMVQGVALAVLLAVVVAWLGSAVVRSYAWPKQDFREAARLVASQSSPGSVVLCFGMRDDMYIPEGLQYYLDMYGAPQKAVDGRTLDYASARRIADGGEVWGLLYGEAPAEDEVAAREAGYEVVRVVGLTVLRPVEAGQTAVDRATALLDWRSRAGKDGSLEMSRLAVRAASGSGLGENLLQQPTQLGGTGDGGWELAPGIEMSPDGQVFTMRPENREPNAIFTLENVRPGSEYLLTFRCRNSELRGAQLVFATAHSGSNWTGVFPGGLGFRCVGSEEQAEQGFAFVMPDNSTTLKVWLRATGTGSAEFSDVQLREIK
jgi:4-amino-4-deoxy-L-arabinose transferase-like glycosyltransferase